MSTLYATQVPPHFIPALALPFEPDPPPKASTKPVRPARPTVHATARKPGQTERKPGATVRYPK